ncbi:diadenylate cyclase [Natronocalculus amylovorans]|uniref:Diadenylate cyclase n=1 Tax=Natronocalculus amylovorans TaxID=2917812 RepID=A0AAE3K9B5_9EURY|nr:diadenylate cyclase [Natronocalculus amylovorans]MCL9818187.1 diadenylate cyclase [Natronocalculus amylovorans]
MALQISYGDHENVVEIVDRVRYCLESISLSFSEWNSPRIKGPGVYIAVIADRQYGEYADIMGKNQWPISQCMSVYHEDAFYDACETVCLECDGGVVIAVDGQIEPTMVRFRDLGTVPSENGSRIKTVNYKPWMGARHMSAIETSVRPEVIATITLSEESGRVSVFRDGEMESRSRQQIATEWRAD